jgi:phage replication O-like protein O
MANPQTENGYLKLANELYDAIIRTDFSKRQRSILDLIMRMSYGCNKKSAHIPKLKFFELAGVYRTDIKKELTALEAAGVIMWDRDNDQFAINKNYEEWQIKSVKGYDKQTYNELIRLNLTDHKDQKVSKTLTSNEKVSEILTNSTGEQVSKTLTSGEKVSKILTLCDTEVSKILTFPDQKVSEILTNDEKVSKTLTNEDQKVSKTLTKKLVKHLPENAAIPHGSRDEGAPKDIYKNIYINKNNNKEDEEEKENNIKAVFDFYEQNGFGFLTEFTGEMIGVWLDDPTFLEPEKIIIRAMQEAIKANTRNWNYVERCLFDWKGKNLRTLEQVETAIKEREARINAKHSRSYGPTAKNGRANGTTGGNVEPATRPFIKTI